VNALQSLDVGIARTAISQNASFEDINLLSQGDHPMFLRVVNWLQRLSNTFMAGIETAMYPMLSLAQLALAIVSAVTTYYGFLLLVPTSTLAVLSVFGLQSMVFWLPRRFHVKRPLARYIAHVCLFACSLSISIVFSYQTIFEKVVDKAAREAPAAETFSKEADDIVHRAQTMFESIKARTELELTDITARAQRELDKGGTTSAGSKRGSGEIYRGLVERQERVTGTSVALNDIGNNLNQEIRLFYERESQPDTPSKWVAMKQHVSRIVSLAESAYKLMEDSEGARLVHDLEERTNGMEVPGQQLSGEAGKRQTFMDGLNFLARAFVTFLSGGNDKVTLTTLLALFIAVVIDLLVVILGYFSSEGSVPQTSATLIAKIARVGEIRRNRGELAIIVERSPEGASRGLTREQELILEQLVKTGCLHLSAASNRSGKVDVYYISSHALHAFVEPILEFDTAANRPRRRVA
jgi:hypothetical protein